MAEMSTAAAKFATFSTATTGASAAALRAQVESFATAVAQALPAMKRACESLERTHRAARLRPCGCRVQQVTNVDPYGLAQSA